LYRHPKAYTWCERRSTYASSYGWHIDKWDVSRIKDFSHAFAEIDGFNHAIDSWDVSNATNMGGMFYHALSFNQDLSLWGTSNNVTT
jgi:hypothetical protein